MIRAALAGGLTVVLVGWLTVLRLLRRRKDRQLQKLFMHFRLQRNVGPW